MSQNSLSCPNTAGATFRTNVNNAFDTLLTLNSGTAAPGTTSAGMLWYDTTNAVVKQRNATNTAWITRWTVANAEGTLGTNLIFTPDNTFDIGASGATRPRTGYFGTSVRTPLIVLQQGDSSILGDTGSGRIGINGDPAGFGTGSTMIFRGGTAVAGANIEIYHGSTQSVLFTSAGYVKASDNGTFRSSTDTFNEFYRATNTTNPVLSITSAAATATNQYGVDVILTGDPNDATRYFFTGYGTSVGGAIRIQGRSNGGLANFQANDVNLSDLRVKPVFEVYTDPLLDDLEEKFLKLERGRFKYADQTHGDWNYGKSAQSVQAVLPELADVWNPMRHVLDEESGEMRIEATPESEQLLCEYSHDIGQIGEAILARLVKRVRALEARATVH